MLLSCHINLVKLEKLWLSKILEMTYNLERREYLIKIRHYYRFSLLEHLYQQYLLLASILLSREAVPIFWSCVFSSTPTIAPILSPYSYYDMWEPLVNLSSTLFTVTCVGPTVKLMSSFSSHSPSSPPRWS